MEIKVADIPAEGLEIELLEAAEGIESLGADTRLSSSVKAGFALRKVGATVYLAGRFEAVLELACSRCGKAFLHDAASELKLDLNPLESAATEEERELQPGDLEVEFYKNGVIETAEFLREQLLLQVPMKPLCKDDCKGLCQYCGQDLNEGQCGCEPPAGHPGLAGLKDLLKDK